MTRSLLVLLTAILVGVGLAVWLLGGGLPSDGGDEVARGAGDGGGPGTGLEAGGDGASAGRTEAADAGPVLFGRPAAERVGRGGVHGKVLTAATNEPVTGAKVLLTGVGFGGEDVALRAETDEAGGFRIPEVPAGDDYDLSLEARPLPGRTLPGVSVRDGTATALGTLWLGARVAFAGRVVDEGGRGVAAAVVGVHAGHFSLVEMFGNLTELFSNLDREPEALAQTTTDGRGGFEFASLDPGPLTMTVRAAGYEPLHREVVAAERATEAPLVLRMLAGQVVAGRVVDARGAGLSGARVAAVSSESPLAFLYGRSFTQTDADGAFRVDASASTDEVMLLASAPGYAVTMVKTPPGSTGVEIVLDRSATLVVRILQAPGGEPIEGASLLLGVSASGALQGDDPQTIVSGVTDATGRVACDVPPGRIQMVMASCADGRFGMWQGGSQGFQNPMLMEGPEDGTIEAGRQQMEFRIRDSVIVEGTVRDADGVPVVGARVVGGAGLQMARPSYTDGDGRYRVRQNPGGFALLVVRADGFVPLQETMQDLPERGTAERDLTLTRAAVVTGRVLTEDGKPLPGARVRAKGATTPGFGGMGFLGESEGITDGQGRYVVDGVSPGAKVRVVARHTMTTDGVSEPFEVGTGGSVRAPDVTLRSGKRVDVLVRDPDGRPLPKARVELSYDRGDFPDWDTFDMWSNDANLVTDAQGHVRQDQVPACELTVTATHPDFARGRSEKTILPEATSPIGVEVAVTVPVTVGGQVLDEGGRPVEGAWVTVQSTGETFASQRATTDAEGRFVVAGVPTGPFTLHAGKQGFRPYEAELGAAREDLVVTLAQYSPETAARRAELQSRLQAIYGRLGSATNDKEREAITAEIRAVSEELQALNEASTDR